jgi:acyl-[acyl-carrier-protein]-phospholipid O-acyltransferase/long-chain-fatty-acid--[acyl-carrier-protein] ligase
MPTPPSKRRLGFSAFLATLFLGAFNDNVSKLLVICYGTEVLGADSRAAAVFLPAAAACFILPFLVFSDLAGHLADRFRKRTVMIWAKVAEIAIMALGFLLARQGAVYPLLAVLFLMGAQSTFFSPAKYGFLPETHSEEELPKANGHTQLWTFLAIIAGGAVGGKIAAKYGTAPAGGFVWCIAFAALGTITSFFITPTPRCQPDLAFRWRDPITPHLATFREIRRDQPLLVAFFGNTFFWFMGTILQLVLMTLAKVTLHGDNLLVGKLQAVVALGIGIGCTLAGYASKGRIRFDFVRPAGLALAITAFAMAIFGAWRLPAYLFTILLGCWAGIYQLPLGTAIQDRSPATPRGRYLAAGNILDSVSMIAASILLGLLSLCHVGARGVFAVVGALMLLVLPWLQFERR